MNDQNIITNPEEIITEIKHFYKKLYSKREAIDITLTKFNEVKSKVKKLDKDKIKLMEREITLEELYTVVKQPKNDKSPGPDGFSNEYFKIFWPDLGT